MFGWFLAVVVIISAAWCAFLIQDTSWRLGYEAALRVYKLSELPYNTTLIVVDQFREECDIFLVKLAAPTEKDRQTQFLVRIRAHVEIHEKFVIVDEQGMPSIVSPKDVSVTA